MTLTLDAPPPGACPPPAGRFGCCEFEVAAAALLAYLADPKHTAGIEEWQGDPGPPSGWEKRFRVDTIPGIGPWLFAALCCAGWITHVWFPKGAFIVSEVFIRRVAGLSDADTTTTVKGLT